VAPAKDAAVLDAGVSDLDYLKSRMRQSLADDAADLGSDDDEAHDAAAEDGSAYGLEAEAEDAAGSDDAGETAEAAVGAAHLQDSEPGATAEGASLLGVDCGRQLRSSNGCQAAAS
jgi:hypothetical protein